MGRFVLFLVIIFMGFIAAMVMDDLVLAVVAVGQSIIWSAFYLGDKLDER